MLQSMWSSLDRVVHSGEGVCGLEIFDRKNKDTKEKEERSKIEPEGQSNE